MQININHKKNSWYTNLTISADLYGLLASRVLKEAEKLVLKFPRTLYLDITTNYNSLISESILKFQKWKAKSTSKTQQLTLIYTEVNIYSKTWTKFLLNNRESAGVNCQPMKLPSHRYPLKKLEEKLPQTTR